VSRPKKSTTGPVAVTPRQARIRELQGLRSSGRSEADDRELADLLAEERRDRWLRLFPGRANRAMVATRNLWRMANPKSYLYTEDEARQVVEAMEQYTREIKRAFTGSPKERGLFDW
jgi:hypothetical protein